MICPVKISFGDILLSGDLFLPKAPKALVIFADPGVSSRVSRGSRAIAQRMYRKGYAALTCDLLAGGEDQAGVKRFDIGLLTKRLTRITMWARTQASLKDLRAGYFASGTGAAAALAAASLLRYEISCVVSRSGRPDLAGEYLRLVEAPVLLIEGALDTAGIEANQRAMHSFQSDAELLILPGASHLFEEPGRAGRLFRAAIRWFGAHLDHPAGNYLLTGAHS